MSASDVSLSVMSSRIDYSSLSVTQDASQETKMKKIFRSVNESYNQFLDNTFRGISDAKEILSSPLRCFILEFINLLGVTTFSSSIQKTLTNGNFEPENLKIMLENYMQSLQAAGLEIPDGQFSPESILNSTCPKHEYLTQLASYSNIPHPLIFEALNASVALVFIGVIAPIFEEVVFREVIQNNLLKTGVKKIVTAISPHKASFIDTKIYTLARIIFTCLIFALSHNINKLYWSDSVVDDQVYYSFFMGFLLGSMREVGGLSLPIAAHIVNNVASVILPIFIRC